MAISQNAETLARRKKFQLFCLDKSLTKQSFAKEVNINNIMSKFERTGVIEHLKENPGTYGDFSNTSNYQESLNQVIQATDMFEQLPAQIRKYFHNDPVAFLDFADNPENEQKMRDMGLLPPLPPVQKPNPVTTTEPATTEPTITPTTT